MKKVGIVSTLFFVAAVSLVVYTIFSKKTKKEIRYDKYVVDLDKKPFLPKGWTLISHKKEGIFRWDTTKVKLIGLDEKVSGSVSLSAFGNQLNRVSAFNANLLDFLLANPQYIPKSWQEIPNTDSGEGNDLREIYFYGTIYRDEQGHLTVRALYYQDGEWEWHPLWLVDDITYPRFAAVQSK